MRSIIPTHSRIGVVQGQNLYGSESNIDQIHEGGNASLLILPQSRIIRVQNENVYDSESNIDQIYEGGNLRLIAMPLGGNQYLALVEILMGIYLSIIIIIIFRVRLIIKTCIVISLPKMI